MGDWNLKPEKVIVEYWRWEVRGWCLEFEVGDE
jgi:hypothetical protein